MKIYYLAFLVALFSGVVRSCNNKFSGKQLRVTGDWSSPAWNAADPNGLLKFDETSCLYTLAVGGLKPNTQYAWKVKIFKLKF